jgi:hypothetical protein
VPIVHKDDTPFYRNLMVSSHYYDGSEIQGLPTRDIANRITDLLTTRFHAHFTGEFQDSCQVISASFESVCPDFRVAVTLQLIVRMAIPQKLAYELLCEVLAQSIAMITDAIVSISSDIINVRRVFGDHQQLWYV